MFSKLKALLRRAEERSVSSLWDRIGTCLDQVGRPECANYFKAAGYAPALPDSALDEELSYAC
jgi:hypothetical protein